MPGWIYQQISTLSWSSLQRWKKAISLHNSVESLADGSKHRPRDVDHEVHQYLIERLIARPHLCPKHLHRSLLEEFAAERVPHVQTVRRLVAYYATNHKGLMDHANSPNDHRSRRRRAFGTYAVERYNERWELDSTRADFVWQLLDENQRPSRFHMVMAINVFSRQVKVLVCRTSNSHALGALTRDCLLDWGVPESIKTDNGKDYLSNYYLGLLAHLGVAHLSCRPFSPSEKPYVERAFGTLNHSYWVESHERYLGHNVVMREKIRARDLFRDNIRGKAADREIAIVETNASLREMQAFVNQVVEEYNNTPHSGLPKSALTDGKLRHMTPNERAAGQERKLIDNPRALDVLLLPAAGGGGYRSTRRKEGIQVGNLPNGERAFYFGPELVAIGERYDQVYVKLDDQPGFVHLFVNESCGEFLATLQCYQLTGNDAMPAIARTREAEKALLAPVKAARANERKRLRIAAQRPEVREAATVTTLHPAQERHGSKALTAAAAALAAADQREPGGVIVPILPELPAAPKPKPAPAPARRELGAGDFLAVFPRVIRAYREQSAVDPDELRFIGGVIEFMPGEKWVLRDEFPGEDGEEHWKSFLSWVEEGVAALGPVPQVG